MSKVFYRRKKTKGNPKGNFKRVTFGNGIIEYLRSISPRPATPKEIAFEMGTDYAQTKAMIAKLYYQKRIERSIRGFYRALYSLDDILAAESPEMRLHGIKLEGKIAETEHASISRLPFWSNTQQASGNRKMVKIGWEGRTVTLLMDESDKLEIYLRSSMHSISFMDFEKFASWIDGLFNGRSHLLSLMVVQLGIGRDFKRYQLDGIKSIKFGQWRNAWAQIYQKTQSMRAEIHIQERIGLGDAIHILRGMTEPLKPQETVQINKTEPGTSMYG